MSLTGEAPGATGMPGYRRTAPVRSGRAGSIPAASISVVAVAHDRRRVIVTGEIDLATGPRLSDVLCAAQAAGPHVVLDLRGTTFLDMSGVRVLLAAAARARNDLGTFEIVHATAPVERLLALTGADRALACGVPSTHEAGGGAVPAPALRAPYRARREFSPARSAAS